MIKHPTEALKRRRLESVGVALALGLAWVVPGAFGMAAVLSADVSQAWLESYEPVVYMAPEAMGADARELGAELGALEGVGEAKVRTRADALITLREGVGEEQVEALGVTEAMMPLSVVVVPSVPAHGHVELAARVGAMEARKLVERVDVPSGEALGVRGFAREALVLAFGLALLGLCAGAATLAGFLRSTREDERRELEVLEIFGAGRGDLGRGGAMRGGVIGAWAGVGASCAMVVLMFFAQRHAGVLLGQAAFGSAQAWAMAAAPLLASPLLGVLVGALISRRRGRGREVAPGIESALAFGMSP